MEPEELASAIKRLTVWAEEHAPEPEPPARRRLREHLGADPRELPVVSRALANWDRPNFQVAIDAWSAGREAEVVGLPVMHGYRAGLAELIQGSEYHGRIELGAVEHVTVPLGEHESVSCVRSGFWLVRDEEGPAVVMLKSAEEGMGIETLTLEVMALERGRAEHMIGELAQLMRECNVYRGRVLSLRGRPFHGEEGAPLTVRTLPSITRDAIVLPDGVLERIGRQAFGIADHAERLRASGRHLRRGLLLHGPPGTGKTLTAMYLAAQMPGRTAVLLTGQGLGAVGASIDLAKALQPALVIRRRAGAHHRRGRAAHRRPGRREPGLHPRAAATRRAAGRRGFRRPAARDGHTAPARPRRAPLGGRSAHAHAARRPTARRLRAVRRESAWAGERHAWMRVLVTTLGYSGHVLPLVPLARASMDAGHEVRVLAPRSKRGIVERAGLICWPYDDAPEAAWRPLVAEMAGSRQVEADARVIADGFAAIGARAALPAALDVIARWRPDVVVRESYDFAGALAAELHGVPCVRIALGPASTEAWVIDLAAGAVDEIRTELGLPPDPDGDRLRDEPCWSSTPPAFDDGPQTMRFRGSASSPTGSASNEGPDVARFRGSASSRNRSTNGDAPLVYFTLGSVAGGQGYFPGFYREAIEALAALPVRLLVTTGDGDPAQLGALPANVRAVRWVPQHELLAEAVAVVCHGGYGTVLGALEHGVPLVLLPLFAGDQWRTARRVEDVGAGIALPRQPGPGRLMFDPPSAQELAALPGALTSILDDPAHRAAAERIAGATRALRPLTDVDPLRHAAGGVPRLAPREPAQPVAR